MTPVKKNTQNQCACCARGTQHSTEQFFRFILQTIITCQMLSTEWKRIVCED